MQKIIVAFDKLNFSESALQYAIYISQLTRAHLTGIFFDDPFYHEYSYLFDWDAEASAAGGVKIKNPKEQKGHVAANAVKNFERKCRESSVKYSVHYEDNITADDLVKETIFADLLIISAHETLNIYSPMLPSSFIKTLLKHTYCPVLLAPQSFAPFESISVLYNGEPSSVLALKMFSYLFPGLDELKTKVISLKENGSVNQIPENDQMKNWMELHFSNIGYNVVMGKSEESLIEELHNERRGTLIIAGAYQRSDLSMWLHPSLADKLVQRLPHPIFIAHN
jgi:hypothetical protein